MGESGEPDRLSAERERVLDAYAKRRQRVRDGTVDPTQYTCFNRGYLFLHQKLERRVLQILADRGYTDLSDVRILDVGCGDGIVGESDGIHLVDFLKYGAQAENLHGVDIQQAEIERGRSLNPAMRLEAMSAEALPYEDASFDIVSQSTVFSSVLDMDMRMAIAAEMQRVLKPSGMILWYDFRVNNPRNSDIKKVSREELRSLFPSWSLRMRSASLASPIARPVARRSWVLVQALNALPFLRTHYLGTISPPAR